MVFELVFQPEPNSEVPGSRSQGSNISHQNISRPLHYRKMVSLEIFVYLIMFQDRNQVVAPPVT
jgi:hypothetical protein